MRALFVTWDGPEQDYLRSLFFPQFAAARRHGVEVEVLQLGWSPRHATGTAKAAKRIGLSYSFVRALRHPRVLATATAIARGAFAIRQAVRARPVHVVVPRSIIPAAMVLASRSPLPMVFDADGLVADERVDFSGWNPSSPMYRLWRDCEAQAVRSSRAVITRTQRAKEILLHRGGASVDATRIHVVPNGKDPRAFSPRDDSHRSCVRAQHGVPPDALWCVIVGSHGPQYLPERSIELFAEVQRRRPAARLHVLTGQEQAYRDSAKRAGVDERLLWIGRVAPEEVADVLSAADCGFALRAATFSQQAVCPIKVGEYLLCGLPVVATRGVGDLDQQLGGPAALLLGGPGANELRRAADWIATIPEARGRLRVAARELGMLHFSLDVCSEAFSVALGASNEAEQALTRSVRMAGH